MINLVSTKNCKENNKWENVVCYLVCRTSQIRLTGSMSGGWSNLVKDRRISQLTNVFEAQPMGAQPMDGQGLANGIDYRSRLTNRGDRLVAKVVNFDGEL